MHVCPTSSPRRRPLRAPCCANPSRDRRPAASCPLPAPQTFSPPTFHGPTSPPGRLCVLPLLNLRVRGKPKPNCRPPGRCDRTHPHPHRTALGTVPLLTKLPFERNLALMLAGGRPTFFKISSARCPACDSQSTSKARSHGTLAPLAATSCQRSLACSFHL